MPETFAKIVIYLMMSVRSATNSFLCGKMDVPRGWAVLHAHFARMAEVWQINWHKDSAVD